ncbi:MAG: Rrf2 family transcriptional regulator [Verrucomicrobiota bacterium]
MQITRAGEYGVLGLLNLARRDSQELAMIEEVSRQEAIPKSFLAKIFQSLVKAGIIRSTRGSGGGFALSKAPEKISVLEVIEAIEGKIAFQRCQQEEPDCEHVGGCALCSLLGQAQESLKEIFSQTTLADLLKPKTTPGMNHRRGNLQKVAVKN